MSRNLTVIILRRLWYLSLSEDEEKGEGKGELVDLVVRLQNEKPLSINQRKKRLSLWSKG